MYFPQLLPHPQIHGVFVLRHPGRGGGLGCCLTLHHLMEVLENLLDVGWLDVAAAKSVDIVEDVWEGDAWGHVRVRA